MFATRSAVSISPLGGPRQPLDFVQRQFKPDEMMPPPGADISDPASVDFPQVRSALETRLRCRQLPVVDATGLASRARAQLVALAVQRNAVGTLTPVRCAALRTLTLSASDEQVPVLVLRARSGDRLSVGFPGSISGLVLPRSHA